MWFNVFLDKNTTKLNVKETKKNYAIITRELTKQDQMENILCRGLQYKHQVQL